MKKILVFGGTRFFGKALVQRLINKGHEVTIATRGQTKDEFGPSVKRIIVDRENKESLIEEYIEGIPGNKYENKEFVLEKLGKYSRKIKCFAFSS